MNDIEQGAIDYLRRQESPAFDTIADIMESLLADKRRMDWLDKYGVKYLEEAILEYRTVNIREAIDAAIDGE
jgi:hypothetical protein